MLSKGFGSSKFKKKYTPKGIISKQFIIFTP
jgi:hypothetical protein